jgi:hypothetical protein
MASGRLRRYRAKSRGSQNRSSQEFEQKRSQRIAAQMKSNSMLVKFEVKLRLFALR